LFSTVSQELSLFIATLRILNAFVIFLQIKTPPDPHKYLGSYNLISKWIEDVVFNVTFENDVIQLHQIPGLPQVSFLNYIDDNVLEIVYKPGFACSVYGMGENHEKLHFEKVDASGKSSGFKFGPYYFVRTKTNVKSRKSRTVLSKIF